jgi:hypothetical protein
VRSAVSPAAACRPRSRGHLNSPVQGLYTRKRVYDAVVGLDTFQPWLDRVVHFPEAIIYQIYQQIPAEWFEDDVGELSAFLVTLMARRKRARMLVTDCRRANPHPFPKWKSA